MLEEIVIHEQVKKQLNYLKSWVDGEKEREERCKEWGIPYTPSRRKDIDKSLYEEYKNEIERNGDKNLLVFIKINGENGINIHKILPFARRYVYKELFVHWFENGGELLCKNGEYPIINY